MITHDVMKYICVFTTNLIAYFIKLLVSTFNKASAEDIGEFISKRYYIIPSFIVFFIITIIDLYFIKIGSFPEEWRLSIRQPITNAVESLTVNPGFIAFTKGLRAFVYLNLLRPLDIFLTHIPWWYTLGAVSYTHLTLPTNREV